MHLDRCGFIVHLAEMAVNPETTVRKIFSLPKEAADAVDNYRFENRFKSEAEAIRRLVELGLVTHNLDDALATLSARAFSLSTADGLPEFIEDELEAIADALDDLRKALKTPKA